jgi:hypothetical protein
MAFLRYDATSTQTVLCVVRCALCDMCCALCVLCVVRCALCVRCVCVVCVCVCVCYIALCVVWCALYELCCAICVVRCVLFVVRCAICVVRCMLSVDLTFVFGTEFKEIETSSQNDLDKTRFSSFPLFWTFEPFPFFLRVVPIWVRDLPATNFCLSLTKIKPQPAPFEFSNLSDCAGGVVWVSFKPCLVFHSSFFFFVFLGRKVYPAGRIVGGKVAGR